MADTPEHRELNVTGPMDGPQADLHPVDAAVGMEARIMLKSVRIPAEGTIPAELADEIRKTVAAHVQSNKITFREVSAQIGVGESTISEVLRGKYHQRADDSPILRKLNSWIDDDERRRRKVRPVGFYPTCVFEAIRSLAQYAKSNARIPGSRNTHGGIGAQDLPRIVIGWGPAGCGKSLGAAALHAEDTLSIMVRVDQRRGSDFGLAELIMDAAGWRGRARNRSLINFIMEKLRDSGRLLIVDEAHRLKRSGCELLRDLSDVCGVPICLLATQEFYEHLTRVRTKSGDLFYDQFSRRVGLVVNLIKGVDGKGGVKRPIYSIEEVRQIFRADGVRLSPGAIDYLTAVSCTPGLGMLGLAAVIFELALRSALRKNRMIDEPLLRKCAERVLIPAGEIDAAILRQIDQVQQTNRQIAARAAG